MSDMPEKCLYCGGTTHVYRQKYHPTKVISTRFEGQFTQALPTETIGFAVECDTCGAVGPIGKTREEAIALFNRRTQSEADNAPLGLEELRGMDGEPVWVNVADGRWGLVDLDAGEITMSGGWGTDIQVLIGQIYRRPPDQ